MIKIAPHGTVSPQMLCIKSMKGWFIRPQTCKILLSIKTYRTQKIRLQIIFSLKSLSLSLKSHMNVL